MSKLSPLPHQLKLLQSESPIVILNWKRMQGTTVGMFMKWLNSGQSALMVDYRDLKFNQCCHFLKDNSVEFTVTGDRVSGHRRIVLDELSCLSIDFYSANGFVDTVMFLRPNHGLWLIDNVDEYFNWLEVKRILERLNHKQQIVFSCDYGNLGWRHLEYYRGEVATRPETGNLVARDYSWDKVLIDWSHKNLKRTCATKVEEDFYIKEVEIL